MKTIKFEDGYTVKIDDDGVVHWKTSRGNIALSAMHFEPVPEGEPADWLRRNGKRPEDYLFAKVALGKYFIRATNGVREAIAQAAAVRRKQLAEREAARQAEINALREKARAASGLKEPVEIHVKYFDGDPTSIVYQDVELHKVDWKAVVIRGQFAFMEREALEQALAADNAAKAEALKRQSEIEAERRAKFDAALAEAQRTGRPVVLDGWVTNRCMNGHDKECSFDRAVKYVNPDGTTEVKYTCCY